MTREALKQALEALEAHADIGIKSDKAITAIKSVLAQPDQAPAFYGFLYEEECCVHICYSPRGPGGPNNELPTAYYTAPPKRQPLTDGEIADLYFDNFSMGELTAFARAIEAAHDIGEKT